MATKIFDKSQETYTKEEIQKYARVYFKEAKGLFIHIPKTGGISMNVAIKTQASNEIISAHTYRMRRLLELLNRRPMWTFELSRVDYFREILGVEKYNSLFSFAVVRNPWDRYVSNWKWLTRMPTHIKRHPEDFPNQVDLWKARGFEGEWGNVSFADFVTQTARVFDSEEIDLFGLDLQLPGFNSDLWHLQDQITHLLDSEGNLGVTFVAKFETLDADVEYACKQVGIPKLSLQHFNQGRDPEVHYSSHYTPELYEIIKKRCKADIDYFNYEFDDQAGILPKKKK